MDATALSGISALLFGLLGLILAALWIFVPFAIFGIKPLLGRLLAEQRRTNQLLEGLYPALARVQPAPVVVAREQEPTLGEVIRETRTGH